MFTGLIVVAIIASVLLVLIVLAQNPKGGINGQMGGATNALGAKNTTDFLETATWVLASVVLIISISASFVLGKKSEIKDGTPGIEAVIGEDLDTDIDEGIDEAIDGIDVAPIEDIDGAEDDADSENN